MKGVVAIRSNVSERRAVSMVSIGLENGPEIREKATEEA
jgi:hypothetical protein